MKKDAEIAKIYGNNLFWNCEEEICASFAVALQSAKITAIVCNECLVKTECHFICTWYFERDNILIILLQCVWLVAQACWTLCHPVDYRLPGSSVNGIFQATILECVAISFSIYYSIS